MKVKEVSKNKWSVEVTGEDKKKIACIVEKLKPLTKPLQRYGKWKKPDSEEWLWEKIIAQFCVMGGTAHWCCLKEGRKEDYKEFKEKMRLDNLVNKENRVEFLRDLFRDYRPTRFIKKQAEIIDKFLNNKKP